MRQIIKYQTSGGREPFSEWFERLDWVVQAKVDAYVIRVASGGAKGNVKSVGSGVYEIKLQIGPGYRVYFGLSGAEVILLLSGGDKGSQRRDIKTAIEYWKDYRAKNEKL